MAWRDTLVAVGCVSLIPLLLIGVLVWREDVVRRAVPAFVCFGVGALLGAAFFQLIPEAYEAAHDAAARRAVPATVLAGYGVFFLLEFLLHGTHQHHDGRRAAHAHTDPAHAPSTRYEPGVSPERRRRPRRRTLVTLNLVGDATHNLLDGVLIAATFLANPAVGVLTTVAVSLHEVPRELGSFGIFVHGGVAVRRALLYNAATALFALTGAALTLVVGTHSAGVARALLPFAAGNFLYIAASLLVPMLRRPSTSGALLGRVALIALGLAATGVPALFR